MALVLLLIEVGGQLQRPGKRRVRCYLMWLLQQTSVRQALNNCEEPNAHQPLDHEGLCPRAKACSHGRCLWKMAFC